jgi:peptidoglycan/xylan/chitin deacetylase (PgdA/CDA1 family)
MLCNAISFFSRPISRNKLTILNYHQVLEHKDVLRPWEPDSEKFNWQMALLRKHFRPMSLSQGMDLLESGKLPSRSVAVTFDDGYLNNLTVALPILQKYKIPATVFIATAFSEGKNMWNDRILDLFAQHNEVMDLSVAALGHDDVSVPAKKLAIAQKTVLALKYFEPSVRDEKVDLLIKSNSGYVEARKMMNASEIKTISDAGLEIGAHTHNHPILNTLTVDEQYQEIKKNRELLSQWTNKPVAGFAYPNGKVGVDLSTETVNVVKTLGFEYAVSTEPGYVNQQSNRYTLNRFTPWDNTPWKFQARMAMNYINGKP